MTVLSDETLFVQQVPDSRCSKIFKLEVNGYQPDEIIRALLFSPLKIKFFLLFLFPLKVRGS